MRPEIIFSEDREVLEEIPAIKEFKQFKREIIVLHKLGLEDYEIKYLLSLREKQMQS